jgi:DNA repair exonuclease SbcCD ATPase subunit
MKIRKIFIKGFRGARFALSLDFTSAHRSMSVFGENASGKSTITDAIEWFITDKVGHLWREDCKEDSLRNVLIDDSEHSEVTVEFSDRTANTKRLTHGLSVLNDNTTVAFQNLKAILSSDRVWLRHSDIAEFVQQSKSLKRKAIASIIGYDSLSAFRDVIQATINSVERDRQYAASKQRLEEEKRNLLQMAGSLLTTPQMLYDQMNKDIRQAGFNLTVSDRNSYFAVVQELRGKINQEERVEKRILLDSSVKEIASIRNAISTLLDEARLLHDYNQLISDREVVKQIHLDNFLRSGAAAIDAGYVTDHLCPFCLTDYDLHKLRDEVNFRIEAVATLNKKLKVASSVVQDYLSQLAKIRTAADNFATKYGKLDVHKSLCILARELTASTTRTESNLHASLGRHEPVVLPEEMASRLTSLDKAASIAAARANAESKSLSFSEYENKIIGLLERLKELRETFFHYDKCSKTVAVFETQIRSLSARMLESFCSMFGAVASSPWYSVEFGEKAGLSGHVRAFRGSRCSPNKCQVGDGAHTADK